MGQHEFGVIQAGIGGCCLNRQVILRSKGSFSGCGKLVLIWGGAQQCQLLGTEDYAATVRRERWRKVLTPVKLAGGWHLAVLGRMIQIRGAQRHVQ